MTTQQVTTLPTFGAPPSGKLASIPLENDLAAGVEASYGIMKYKGKVWTTHYKGEERALMRPDGDGPRNSIDVVIIKAPKVKSKIYYAGGFVEGSSAAPDCWSTNGVSPDASATHKQSTVCLKCPKNEWGSAPKRQDGTPSKGKACTDTKRVAIVPANASAVDTDMLMNAMLGGPMLLRIPATSLDPMATYGTRMANQGYQYYAVITRISFDPAEAYPKFKFEPVRPLSDAELDVVLELQKSGQVDRIVAEGTPDNEPAAPEAPLQFIAPLPTPTPAAAPPKPVTQQVVQPAAPAPAPVATPAVAALPQDFEAELDALLN